MAHQVVHSIATQPEAAVIALELLPASRMRIVLKRRSPSSADPDDFAVVQGIAFDVEAAHQLRSALMVAIRQLEADLQ